MVFTDAKEIKKHVGGVTIRIAEYKGELLINPTLELLKEVMPDFSKDEEIEYLYDSKLSFGFTDFIAKGGKKILSEKLINEGALIDPTSQTESIDVKEAKIMMVVELDYIEDIVEAGKIQKIPKKALKLLTFRFKNVPAFYKEGSLKEVYNIFGGTTFISADGVLSSTRFDKNAPTFDMPLGSQGLGFKEFINFMYSYGAQIPNSKIDLFSKSKEFDTAINLTDIFEGDFTSIKERFEVMHSNLKGASGLPLYGALGYLTVTLSKDKSIQTWYEIFERGVMNSKGEVNVEMKYIKNNIANSRKPAKNGKIYSVESKGVFVGVNGRANFGLMEIKDDMLDDIRALTGQSNIPIQSIAQSEADNDLPIDYMSL